MRTATLYDSLAMPGAKTTSQKVLDALPFQLAIIDKRGIIQRVNAAWSRFAQENGGDARIIKGIGIDYLGVVHRDKSQSAQHSARGIQSVLTHQSPEFSCEYPCHGAGQRRWFIMRVSPLRGKSGGAVIAHFNITERVLAEKALKRAKRDLESSREKALQAEREGAQFLAHMSHEIRTPLTGILGLIEGLKESPLNPTQQVAMRTLDGLADHLLAIVNDVLDLSKLEAGKLRVENLPFDPSAVAEEVCRILGSAAEKKGLELSWKPSSDFPNGVSGDARRLRQMLLNLVNNAIKFTQVGSVRMIGKTKPANGDNLCLEFSVQDTGPGIESKNLKQLFHRFKQIKNDSVSTANGTGLGLVITKNLAEAMGGKVTVKSKVGQGSEFTVSVLVQKVREMEPKKPSRDWTPIQSAAPKSQAKTLLIADDNEVNRMILTAILEKLGYTALAAKDGQEAIDLWEQNPNLAALFLDCQMPRLDGYEATQRIRQQETKRLSTRIPIVAITADIREANIHRCKEVGMDEILSKPFRSADVMHLLERMQLSFTSPAQNTKA